MEPFHKASSIFFLLLHMDLYLTNIFIFTKIKNKNLSTLKSVVDFFQQKLSLPARHGNHTFVKSKTCFS